MTLHLWLKKKNEKKGLFRGSKKFKVKSIEIYNDIGFLKFGKKKIKNERLNE